MAIVRDISELLDAMSRGDLTVSVKREYIGDYAPIKTALITILDSLNRSMSEIEVSAQQVLAGAGQIAQSAMYLAEGATKQASAIEELTA
jgi:methyl-accepting chemotaxis protein